MTETGTDLTADAPPLRTAYRERAHLLAVLAAHYPSALAPAGADPGEPELPVLYLHPPTGQLS